MLWYLCRYLTAHTAAIIAHIAAVTGHTADAATHTVAVTAHMRSFEPTATVLQKRPKPFLSKKIGKPNDKRGFYYYISRCD